MLKSQILIKARELITDAEVGTPLSYLCNAVSEVAEWGDFNPETLANSRAICAHISRLIRPYGTLGFWLLNTKVITYAEMDNWEKLRATRLAWCDDLINYYEGLGE